MPLTLFLIVSTASTVLAAAERPSIRSSGRPTRGVRSAPIAAAAPPRSPGSPARRLDLLLRRAPAAASGRPPTAARTWKTVSDGFFGGSIGAVAVSACGPERRLRRRRRGDHPRQRRRTATASRSRPTPARPGSTIGLDGHAAHRRASASIRRIPTSSTPRSSATPSARTRCAASTARRTAATLGARPLRQRQRRRGRPGHGPDQPAHPLRRLLAGAAHAVQPGERRRRRGPVEEHRRRRHLDRADAQPGPAQGHPRHHRRHRLAGQPANALRHRRGRGRRRLPLRRRRRDLDARPTTTATCASAPGTTRASTPTRKDEDTRLRRQRPASTAPTTAARPSPRSARRTATTTTCGSIPTIPQRMIEGNDGGANVSHRRRQDLVDRRTTSRPRSSTASRPTTTSPTASSARSRTTRPCASSAARTAAASTSRDWERPPAARAATSSPIRTIPDIVYAGSYGGLLTRLDHRTGEVRDVNAWPDNPMGARRRRAQVPLPVELPDPLLAARSRTRSTPRRNVLFKTHRRRPELAGDLARPDAQRQVASRGRRAGRSPRTTPASSTTARSSPSPSRRSSRA